MWRDTEYHLQILLLLWKEVGGKEMKIKDKCEKCAEQSEGYADMSRWHAERSKRCAEKSKEYANKCQCEEEKE